jgi:DNA-binding NtrC family response regulator
MKDRFDGVVEQLLTAGIFLEQAVEILEKSMIQGALDRNKHNQSAAARTLGIHRNTLQRKMVEFALAAPRARARRKPAGRAGKAKAKKTGAA